MSGKESVLQGSTPNSECGLWRLSSQELQEVDLRLVAELVRDSVLLDAAVDVHVLTLQEQFLVSLWTRMLRCSEILTTSRPPAVYSTRLPLVPASRDSLLYGTPPSEIHPVWHRLCGKGSSGQTE